MKTIIVYLKGRELIFELNNMKYAFYGYMEEYYDGPIDSLLATVLKTGGVYQKHVEYKLGTRAYKNIVKIFFSKENLIQLIIKQPKKTESYIKFFKQLWDSETSLSKK